MKYSMYNVVWYDGVEAYVTKFVLSENEKKAENELLDWWIEKGYCGEILKLDRLYGVTLENIIALRNEDNDTNNCAYERFKEMYFQIVRRVSTTYC